LVLRPLFCASVRTPLKAPFASVLRAPSSVSSRVMLALSDGLKPAPIRLTDSPAL
jgi:hypothetical protein